MEPRYRLIGLIPALLVPNILGYKIFCCNQQITRMIKRGPAILFSRLICGNMVVCFLCVCASVYGVLFGIKVT